MTQHATPHDQQPILVLGGHGKTGSRVAERLAHLGHPVRIGSRRADPPFDWDDPSTWAAALDGVRAVYVVYVPDLIAPGAAEAIRSFSDLAVNNGVRRLVLLSGRGEEEAIGAEDAVQASGADWTVVRCAWFNQNFSEDYLLDPVLEGVIALPAGLVAEPFVDADDIADVAAAALTDDRHVGKLYELTGPRLLTFADVAGEISTASGRDVQYVSVTAEEYADGAKAAGIEPDLVDMLVGLFARVLDGRNAHVSNGVYEALGRPANEFSEYAASTAATGVWNPQR